MSIYIEARNLMEVARPDWHPAALPADGGFKTFTLRELFEDPKIQEQIAFRERCMKTPLSLNEMIGRPSDGLYDSDEVDEQNLCAQFSRNILMLAGRGMPTSGVSLAKESLKELPDEPAAYWLNCPHDDQWRSWRVVYVGKAASLRHRWNNSEHHRLEQARKHRCRLDWWVVEAGTETLVEAALTYQLKPSWNERQ